MTKMTEDVNFIPRSAWFGNGPPDMNNGDPRAKLRAPLRYLTRHYRGSPINNSATADPIKYMVDFERRADSSKKSFEYNACGFPGRSVPTLAEYAGEYEAAHSAGENSISAGFIFALGVNNHPSYRDYDSSKPTLWQPLDENLAVAYRWFRDVYLASRGLFVHGFTEEREHRHMPGASTACPGESVIAGRALLDLPYTPPITPPIDPPEPEVPDVQYSTARFVRPEPYANVFCVAAGIGGNVEAVTEHRIAELVALGVPDAVHTLTEHEPTAKSLARRAGLDPDDSTEFWRVGEYGK